MLLLLMVVVASTLAGAAAALGSCPEANNYHVNLEASLVGQGGELLWSHHLPSQLSKLFSHHVVERLCWWKEGLAWAKQPSGTGKVLAQINLGQ